MMPKPAAVRDVAPDATPYKNLCSVEVPESPFDCKSNTIENLDPISLLLPPEPALCWRLSKSVTKALLPKAAVLLTVKVLAMPTVCPDAPEVATGVFQPIGHKKL
jgi:hypothetical protein